MRYIQVAIKPYQNVHPHCIEHELVERLNDYVITIFQCVARKNAPQLLPYWGPILPDLDEFLKFVTFCIDVTTF